MRVLGSQYLRHFFRWNKCYEVCDGCYKFSHDQKKSRISYGYLLNAILASLTFFTKLTFLVRSEYIKMRRVIGLLWRKCHLKTKLFWVDIDIESFSNPIIYTILKLVFVVKPVDWNWSKYNKHMYKILFI